MSDHGHDSHGHDAHGHDEHGHGHGDGHGEHWGDYNAAPPAPSTLPPLTAVHLSILGVALAVLLAAIVGFSLRLSEARILSGMEEGEVHGAAEHGGGEHKDAEHKGAEHKSEKE